MATPPVKTSTNLPQLRLDEVQVTVDEGSPKSKVSGNPATKAITESSVSAGASTAQPLSDKNVSIKPPSPRDQKAFNPMVKVPAKDEGKKVEPSGSKGAVYAKAAYDAYQKGFVFESRLEIARAWIQYHHAFYLQRKAEREGAPKFVTGSGEIMNAAYYLTKVTELRQAHPYLSANKVPEFND